MCSLQLPNKNTCCMMLYGKGTDTYNPPVKEGGEDEDTQDAEGQDVEDVGQEHLPFTVQTILTLLITDGT